jgi:hypothetical protein
MTGAFLLDRGGRRGTMRVPVGLRQTRAYRWRIRRRTMRTTAATLAVVLLASVGTATARDREPVPSEMAFLPDISGRWEDALWGTVTLRLTDDGRAFEGTYSLTFGKDVGRLFLSYSPRSELFEGTWSEGTYRFGRVSVRLAGSRAVAKGSYSADPRCEFEPGAPASAEFQWNKARK